MNNWKFNVRSYFHLHAWISETVIYCSGFSFYFYWLCLLFWFILDMKLCYFFVNIIIQVMTILVILLSCSFMPVYARFFVFSFCVAASWIFWFISKGLTRWRYLSFISLVLCNGWLLSLSWNAPSWSHVANRSS